MGAQIIPPPRVRFELARLRLAVYPAPVKMFARVYSRHPWKKSRAAPPVRAALPSLIRFLSACIYYFAAALPPSYHKAARPCLRMLRAAAALIRRE